MKRLTAEVVGKLHKLAVYALKMDMIPANPADKIERPKKDKFVGSFYDSSEVNERRRAFNKERWAVFNKERWAAFNKDRWAAFNKGQWAAFN